MREDAFRTVLARLFDPPTAGSYLAYVRRIERDLGIDLDAVPLDETGLSDLQARLIATGMPKASVRNCRAALHHYARQATTDRIVADPTPAPSRPAWMADASAADLVRSYGQILDELRHRGILRTANAPVGDYAEHLFARAFGWALSGNSTSGFDAIDDAGIRYQIKARRLVTKTTSRQLGAIRGLAADPFDYLAAVLFDGAMTVQRAAILPIASVRTASVFVPHTNSWRLMLSDAVLADRHAVDATDRLRAASEG